ncbi:unnamed protein product, partial [Ilex paraguariensis]
MDEKQGGFVVVVGFRDPAVHDRAVAEVGGPRFQAGIGEGVFIAPVSRCCEAETLGHWLTIDLLMEIKK